MTNEYLEDSDEIMGLRTMKAILEEQAKVNTLRPAKKQRDQLLILARTLIDQYENWSFAGKGPLFLKTAAKELTDIANSLE